MKRRICCLISAVVLLLSALPFAAGAEATTLSLAPAAVREGRMWSQQSYNSADYYYVPFTLLHWGRYAYLRFCSDSIQAGEIAHATLRFEARARASEKEVYMAALALSDNVAANMESDLFGTSAAFVKNSTASTSSDLNHKLLTNTNGYYKSEVADSVAAYTKATAADTPTTVNTFTQDDANVYEYPVTVELDVTGAVRTAFASGNHAQFALLAAKQVYDGDGKQLTGTEPFESAHLDTSKPVCGTASYYTPSTKRTDDYFSWMYILPESFTLEIQKDPAVLWSTFAEDVQTLEDLEQHLPDVFSLLDEQSKATFAELGNKTQVYSELYACLQEPDITSEKFAARFALAVQNAYWQGYGLRLEIATQNAGYRGDLQLSARPGTLIPKECKAVIAAYSAQNQKQYERTVTLKDGAGVYDLTAEQTADYLTVRVTDADGTLLAPVQTVWLGHTDWPAVFITELSNRSTVQLKPNTGTQTQGQDVTTPLFQFVELHNYSDKPVDMTALTFEYSDGAKWIKFDWIWDDTAAKMLQPGHTFVIGVYNQYCAIEGLKWETQADKDAFWAAFNDFYRVNIPTEDRVLVACTQSGTDVAISGVKYLPITKTASARITDAKGNVLRSVSLATDGKEGNSYSFQFQPNAAQGAAEEFLFCTGSFPYQLLDEQKADYRQPTFSAVVDPIKIISYNILAVANGTHTVAVRQPLLLNVMSEYQPDSIGLQEVNTAWDDWLTANIPSNYSCVQGISTNNHVYGTISGSWDLMNPIYYRNDKFKLLASGHGFLTPDGKQGTKQWDSANMKRTMTWAVLENKTTGERIAHLNTHLVLSGYTARIEQTKMMYQKGAELKQKYGCGIVITGDHNMREGCVSYLEYTHSGVVDDAKYLTTNHDSVSTYCEFGKYGLRYAVPIDYVMVSPDDYFVQKYEVLHKKYNGEELSDHNGLYVELYTRALEDAEAPVIDGVTDGASYCGGVTFTVSDKSLRTVLLDGNEITVAQSGRRVTAVGTHTVTATDAGGKTTTVTFTVGMHEYGEWVIDKPADCGHDGEQSAICRNCGKKQTMSIKASGLHTSDGSQTVLTPASCKNEGLAQTKCAVCGEAFLTVLPVTGHTRDDGVITKQPTCTDKGVKTYTCTVCGATETEEIAATGNHSWDNGVITKQPTESEEGIKEFTCAVCGLKRVEYLPMIIPTPYIDTAAVFKDVGVKDWFYKNGAINYVYNAGLFGGTTPTTFEPNTNMTRGMFVTVLGRLAGVSSKGQTTKFTDVKKSAYYSGYVKWASDKGIVSGTSATKFEPEANVTREQICKMMTEYCRAMGITLAAIKPEIKFADAAKISSWARGYVKTCQTAGLVNGKENNKFDPQGNATRAEVATILYNFDQNY